MGDYISIGDSLLVTVFSMAVVFLGLLALSFIISILKGINNEKKPKPSQEPVAKTTTKEPVTEKIEITENNDELVAVIAAAVAASMGVSIPELNIKSIRRVPQMTTAWASASRQEQIYGKL